MLGWLPDPEDERDLGFDKLGLDSPPPRASAHHLLAGPYDQGELGSCVAQVVAKLVEASHRRQNEPPTVASRLAIYYLSRAVLRTQRIDSGTHLRTAFMVLNRFGFCPEEVWPYSDATDEDAPFRHMPPTQAFRMSFDQSAKRSTCRYRRILSSGAARIRDVKRAIANGMPVGFGTEVSVDFAEGRLGTGAVLPPRRGSDVAGGHAMIAGGYEGDWFEVLNSWGEDFGDGGWCRLDETYVAQWRDLWTVEHAAPYQE